MLDLTVCIVSWNIEKLLRDCLNAVFNNTKDITFEVIVVDNNSSDNSVQMVQKEFPQVKLIVNDTNAGFTIANNKALRIAKGRNTILLNSDTEVIDNALGKMVAFMDSHKECGALGCKLLNSDGTLQRSCRAFPTIETMLYNSLGLDSMFPKSKIFGKYMMTWWDHNDLREVDQPMGSALMVKKEVWDKVGLLDENILFWFDEVELCWRIKKAGWKVFFNPEAEITHHMSKGFKQWKSLKQVIKGIVVWRRSRNYFFRKHKGILSVMVLWLIDALQLAIILGILYWIIKFPILLIKRFI